MRTTTLDSATLSQVDMHHTSSLQALHDKRLQRTGVKESADYEVSDGPVVQAHARDLRLLGKGRRVRQVLARGVMCIIAGAFSALLYLAMHHGISWVTSKRINFLREHLGSGVDATVKNAAIAWGFSFGLGLGLCFLGVCCILYEPSAAGSGMPEVIAFLNGLHQPRYLTIKTFIFKLLGTFLIVGAGLFTGFDGPYIHLCSIFAAVLVRNWRKIPFLGAWAYGENQSKHNYTYLSNVRVKLLQQFITIGAACGVASAFQAPLGGAMFALEEAMSFYEPSLILRSLFSAVVSLLIVMGLGHASTAGHIDNKKLSIYETNASCNLLTPVQDYFAVIVMGIVAGVVGHLYNVTVAKIRVMRTHHIQKSIFRRFFEVFVLVVVTSTVVVLVSIIPVYRDCTAMEHTLSHLEDLQHTPCVHTCGEWKADLANVADPTAGRLFNKCFEYVQTRLCFDDNFQSTYIMALQQIANNVSIICDATQPDDTSMSLITNDKDRIDTVLQVMIQEYTYEDFLPESIFLDSLGRNKKHEDKGAAQQPENGAPQHEALSNRTSALRKRSDEMDRILPEAEKEVEEDPSTLCYHQMKSLLFNQPEFILKNLFIRGYYNMFQAATLAVFGLIYVVLSLATHHISMPTDLVIPTLIIGATYGRLYGVMINFFKIKLGQTMVDPGAYAVMGMAAFWSGTSRMVVTVIIVALEATGDQSYLLSLVIAVLISAGVGNMLGESQFHMEIEHSGMPFLPFDPIHKMEEMRVADIMTPDPVVIGVADSLQTALKTVGTSEFLAMDATIKSRRYASAHLHNGFPVVASLNDRRLVGLVLRRQVEEALSSMEDQEYHAHWQEFCNYSPQTVQAGCAVSKAYRTFRSLGLRHMVVVDGENRVIGIITRHDFHKVLEEEHHGGHGHDHEGEDGSHHDALAAVSKEQEAAMHAQPLSDFQISHRLGTHTDQDLGDSIEPAPSQH